MPSAAFLRFWRTDLTRECLLSFMTKEDQASLRLASHECSLGTAASLFKEIQVSFGTNTFTRPARMAALERIGGYVSNFTFSMPHSPDTFLAPLLDPITGEEQVFVYEPYLALHRPSSSGSHSSSKYGSWEMNDLLVKQYSPLFHATTNIPSFVRAFNAMPALRCLKISCPGQSPAQIYRRSAVDYALISLRMAIEQASLPRLECLNLDAVHTSTVFYLRPLLGIGASPASLRRWRQIKTLKMRIDCPRFGDGQPTDHLKFLHSYLQSYPLLEDLSFEWLNQKGPCPLSLSSEQCLAPGALDCSAACPKTFAKPPRALRFRKLRRMVLDNSVLDASQIADFIMVHRKVLREFEFENVRLRTGTWDDALAPLTRISGSDSWKGKQEEVMDVPLMLSPVEEQECIKEYMWEDQKKHRPFRTLRKASMKTKEMLGALRSSVLTWR
ncbi:hypothetical protein EPUS_01043 [Endocarpon pusillum Z07020]|uniref:Uncharacterized protein n=1 Tax=Endocarpon pusillum (strain Z07020 / HMAS-L-300199) TaxID=1263415 RepID=U1FW63_ENDPU|nr:uncharacterized protein EPUS_01043 [Endocarpon pusillum Z07020]ERF69087.1 hypothetical protein EPUS_01043 [Endocarpon pusillum Z07020]